MDALTLPHARHWQPALGREGAVTDLDDIEQSLRLILGTPVGAVPGDPAFGSRLREALDRPAPEVTPQLIREAVEAIARFEPRVVVQRDRVRVAFGGEAGSQGTLTVPWRIADSVRDELGTHGRVTEVRL